MSLKGYSATLNWPWRNLVVSVTPDNGSINKEEEKYLHCSLQPTDCLHSRR